MSDTNRPDAMFAEGQTVRVARVRKEVVSVKWEESAGMWFYNCRDADDPKAPVLRFPERQVKADEPPPLGVGIIGGRKVP